MLSGVMENQVKVMGSSQWRQINVGLCSSGRNRKANFSVIWYCLCVGISLSPQGCKVSILCATVLSFTLSIIRQHSPSPKYLARGRTAQYPRVGISLLNIVYRDLPNRWVYGGKTSEIVLLDMLKLSRLMERRQFPIKMQQPLMNRRIPIPNRLQIGLEKLYSFEYNPFKQQRRRPYRDINNVEPHNGGV